MKFACYEIEGALYKPQNLFQLNNNWIIPATNKFGSLGMKDLKVLFVCKTPIESIQTDIVQFILCYQFLFLKSDVYYYFSLPQNPKSFTENGSDINEIENKIRMRYGMDGALIIDFKNIDTFHTGLPCEVDFNDFYKIFIKSYTEDNQFKNIIDLFLYTIGSKHKLYDNIFQKISQLQTIFETMLGHPEEEEAECGKKHFKEEWNVFLRRELMKKGIDDENVVEIIIKIKNTLNWSARVKYTHYSSQLNILQKTLQDIKTGRYEGKSEYTTNINDIMSNTLKVKDWVGLDWENVYIIYQKIIKLLIYLDYFQKRFDNISKPDKYY